MSQVIQNYLTQIEGLLKSGQATEHSYRPALKDVFTEITQLYVVNEPKRSKHGAPDFIFVNSSEAPVCWAEAKDIGVSLDKIEKSEQMNRYYGYANLILTDGLEFRFYKNGEKYGDPIAIAIYTNGAFVRKEQSYELFTRKLADFIAAPIDSIRSSAQLAKIMGGKGRRLRDNIIEMLSDDFREKHGNKTKEIEGIKEVLTKNLIHDLDTPQFADIYAQTLVYGLFVARYHDDTPEDFTRAEARDRIPASNKFLQQFFDHIAGTNFEKRLSYIVDELCDVFAHSNVHDIVHGLYQKKEDTHDPIIHFYEDFLSEYDPALRKQRGVFYTPLPIVRYIVKSVDSILKSHFGLPEGLADTSKVEYNYTEQGKTSKKQVHRVQILDPATGTGTFLNETILHLYKKFEGQEALWKQYAKEHLVPRLNGFELMMASYTIAHLKLSMTLAETGVDDLPSRLRVFLTNSLEAPSDEQPNLFTLGLQGALNEESAAADEIKRNLPIMVVMGNPPYSVSSSNKGKWIIDLTKMYKEGLQEKSYNALSDDYVKFICFAQHLIDNNKQGIVAMITNNSFIDGLVHRKMRESLLQSFDDIYILDLHGNSKKKEVAPDGGKDENVFDIMQGVSINIFVKTGKKKKNELGKVHHIDLFGKRDAKYKWLTEHNVKNSHWQELEASKPNYFFVPKDFSQEKDYNDGLSLDELFSLLSSGLTTFKDDLVVSFESEKINCLIQELQSEKESELRVRYNLKDTRDWKLANVINDLKNASIEKVSYRPFDVRHVLYSPNSKGVISYPRYEVMSHSLKKNIALLACKRQTSSDFYHVFVTDTISERCSVSLQTGELSYHFPLYLYPEPDSLETKRRPNLDQKIIDQIAKKLQLEWLEDGRGNGTSTFAPEDIFDYIYAILHSPTYRERYKEFLKIDFPRVPFTSNKELFWKLVDLGREVRLYHLMEYAKSSDFITKYMGDGDNVVSKKLKYQDKKVWINDNQYFEGVPEIAWNFYIGGYQPAQKWLRDRKERELSYDDIIHYQKIIVALVNTDRLMKEIDQELERFGGFPIK
ncbi:DNA methyltransferase [Candidatus Peregrinibacteria bacterium CG10_big_fil_rev_8_21_14_0_10_42_8]|nr:MAG: DNA methyltransferase [Candidatus Peregrinibacteria bacterium CG10_big_fil_rev_8_21_14_0_10_42_8]